MSHELFKSARWAAILLLPVLLIAFIICGLMGGIEGDGNYVLYVIGAPSLLLAKQFPHMRAAAAAPVFIFFEGLYYYFMVLLFRSSIIRRPLAASAQFLARVFRAKNRPDS